MKCSCMIWIEQRFHSVFDTIITSILYNITFKLHDHPIKTIVSLVNENGKADTLWQYWQTYHMPASKKGRMD